MSLVPDLGSAFGGPLVAAPVDVSSPFDGLWLVQDGMGIADAVSTGNWVEGGISGFAMLADGLAFMVDPIGSLIGMGLSWVLEHISPLNDYLNLLTGNAGEVLRMSQTWSNIASHLAGAGGDLTAFVDQLSELEGAAMDAYRKFQHDVAEHIQLAGTMASATSVGLEIASSIVKIVHDLTRDVISQIAGTAISAAITTTVTLGFGAPVAIAQVAARVSSLAPKVFRAVEALLRSFEKLTPLLSKLDEINAAIKRVLDKVGDGFGGSRTPDAPASARSPGVPGGSRSADGAGGAEVPTGSPASDAPAALPGALDDGAVRIDPDGTVRIADPVEVGFTPNAAHDPIEFRQQLSEQQDGLNDMTLGEWMDNRSSYLENGRSPAGDAAQSTARREAVADYAEQYMLDHPDVSPAAATQAAREHLADYAPLHAPDQVAGGHPDRIARMGEAGVNSSLGAQWRTRVWDLQQQILDQASRIDSSLWDTVKLDVRLFQ